MSNLGMYQVITSWSKKVKGPVNLLLLVGAAGYGVGRLGEVGIKKIVRKVKRKYNRQKDNSPIYEAVSYGKDKCGLELHIGDGYRILQRDKDAILIEKLGDPNNPYYVSSEFLSAVTDVDMEDENDAE